MYKGKIRENISADKTKFETINQYINRGVQDEKRKKEKERK